MSTRRKSLLGAGVVLLLGFLVFRAVQADRGDAVEVRAEEVGPRDLVARVTATGHIEPRSSVEIQSDISGRIVRLPVEEGEDVEEGDLLLEIDPTQYAAAVRQARARLSEARSRAAQARADYLQAQREWERMEKLQERTPDLVTAQEAEQARTRAEVREAELEAAKHAVEQAEAALEEAQDRLDKTVIRAPMSGRITRLNVEQGETAIVGTMNNPGSHLLTIADLSSMEAVVEVDETDVTQVSTGDSASVEIDAFPDSTFAGRVRKIGNSSMQPRSQAGGGQDDAVDFEVRILLSDPPEGIRPDLSATADVITDRRPDALAIPIISLTLQDTADLGEDWRGDAVGDPLLDRGVVEGVFVVEGGEARFRPVRVGIAGSSHFEVVEGLAAGDTVVSGTYQAIRDLGDGDPVELTRVEARPDASGDG
jgi:HlyD family secretion protein